MQRLLLLFLLLPLSLMAQKDEGFARLIREDGSVIKGSSLVKLYERQIPVVNVESNATSNSTVVRFSMNAEAAAGILRDASVAGKKLQSGEIAVTFISYDKRQVRYKISMENITVDEVTDANGMVIIQLNASRIGWTYYSYSKSGVQTISSKTGWDADRRTAWSGF